jgi:hypothetical protein
MDAVQRLGSRRPSAAGGPRLSAAALRRRRAAGALLRVVLEQKVRQELDRVGGPANVAARRGAAVRVKRGSVAGRRVVELAGDTGARGGRRRVRARGRGLTSPWPAATCPAAAAARPSGRGTRARAGCQGPPWARGTPPPRARAPAARRPRTRTQQRAAARRGGVGGVRGSGVGGSTSVGASRAGGVVRAAPGPPRRRMLCAHLGGVGHGRSGKGMTAGNSGVRRSCLAARRARAVCRCTVTARATEPVRTSTTHTHTAHSRFSPSHRIDRSVPFRVSHSRANTHARPGKHASPAPRLFAFASY